MKDKLYLSNILESTRLINQYLKSKNACDLKDSVLLRDAVCKRIEEIGENIQKVSSKLKKLNPQIDWDAFVEARNFLTHVYQMINIQKLWGIAKRDIPKLETEVKKILDLS